MILDNTNEASDKIFQEEKDKKLVEAAKRAIEFIKKNEPTLDDETLDRLASEMPQYEEQPHNFIDCSIPECPDCDVTDSDAFGGEEDGW